MEDASSILLDYYRDIIPNPEAWREAVEAPLPSAFWVNTLKATGNEVESLLQASDFNLHRIPWHSEAFECDDERSLGKRPEYLSGLIQIQEEVSMLSGVLLNPQPGERVLDLCAAPGNKTAQMAVSMKNSGMLIANDRNYGRMRALGQIMKRLGLLNISTTIYDGATFPRLNNYFDKVMADVPCGCEGTFRKRANKIVAPNRERSLRMGNVQRSLLKKAVKLCKPGGLICYSTCTFAPEENERVIDAILKEFPGEFEVVPAVVPGFTASEGVQQWHGEVFDESVKHALRVWPHQNNTGGFFVALLRKRGEDVCESQVEAVTGDCQDYLKMLQDRYGLDASIWGEYRFIADSNRGIYFTNKDNIPPAQLKIDATGLFFMKTNTRFPKLTTASAMLLGEHATKHVIAITDDQLIQYFKKEEFGLSEDQVTLCESTGFVIIKHRNQFMGTGLYFTPQGELGHRVRSLFPKYLQGP